MLHRLWRNPGFLPQPQLRIALALHPGYGAEAHFWFPEKIVGECSHFVLAFCNRSNIISPVQLRRGARHDRSSRCGAGCGGRYDAGPEVLADYGWNVREPRRPGRLTPARMPCEARKREAGSGGRSKCMSGRQSARTRHVSAKATIPGDMQQAAKSIRVRNAGDDCGPRPVRLTPDHARMRHLEHAGARVSFAKAAYGCSHASAGAAGAALRPVVPHAPTGDEERGRPANPEPEMNEGR